MTAQGPEGRPGTTGSHVTHLTPGAEEMATRLHQLTHPEEFAPRHHDEPQAPKEDPKVEQLAGAIEAIVGSTVMGLSEFPSGLNFPDVIFYDTGESAPLEHQREEGRRVVELERGRGTMRMAVVGARNEHAEWDLDLGTSIPLTPRDKIHYAQPLMDVLLVRVGVYHLDALKNHDAARAARTLNDERRVIEAKIAINALQFKAFEATHPFLPPTTT